MAADDWKFRQLLDVLPAAAYTCDADGLITAFNGAATDVWGRSPKLNDPVDRFCGSFRLFSATDGAPITHDRCWMALALRGDRGYNGCEIVVERPDGTRRTALAYANPLRDERGTLVGAVNVLVDITEQRRGEEALREAARKKDEFLATLAHELRNPLAPLRNALYLLSLDSANEKSRAEAQAMMERQLSQMVRLLDDLNDAARIAHGKIDVRKERIDIIQLVASAVKDARAMIAQHGHTLTIDLPKGRVFIDGDATRLTQVFTNLLNNAAKYTETGGTITVSGARGDDQIALEVADTGVGIPAEMLERIFEPFTQGNHPDQRSRGGLGIGLSLVRGMLEMMGGRVQAYSDGPGTGSRFVVTLPAPSGLNAAAKPTRRPRRDSGGISRRRVLVVEDNADSAASMALLLGKMGHRAYTAGDGFSAVTVAEQIRPEVILFDLGLPRLNGYDAARQIRERPWGRVIHLIALSAWGDDDARERAIAAGFDRHIVKPILPAALEALLVGLERRPPPAHGALLRVPT